MVLTFKTPDVAEYATEGMTEKEKAEVYNQLSRWIQYGENLSVSFDLEAGTATVLEVGRR